MVRLLDGARRHALAVFAAAALLAMAGVALVTRLSFDANILRLLPRTSSAVRAFETYLRQFGSLDHLYIQFESPDSIGDHSDLVDAYVDALRRAPEIESVDAELFEPSKDWSYLFDRALYLLGPAEARRALARLRPPELDAGLAHARDLLSVPSAQIKAYVQRDPVGLLEALRTKLGRDKGFVAFDPTQEGYVTADRKSRLVIVKPKGPPFDTDFCKALMRRLKDIEAEARARVKDIDEGAARVTIEPAGAYRVSLEAERLIRRDGIANCVGALLLLLLFVVVVFRTPWVVLYGTIPLAIAAVLALGIVGALQGQLSPATSGSAGMLFGLGIDGVVVLYLRFLEERDRGRAVDAAIAGTAGTAASVALAQGTTAATFLALLPIDFPTLQDLGALVGVGIVACCVLTLALLPAMLGRRRTADRARALAMPALGRIAVRRSRPILWTAAALTVLLGITATRLRLDPSIDRLQARTAGAEIEQRLARRFSLPLDVLLAVNHGDNLDALVSADARLQAQLTARDSATAVGGISALLPPEADQAEVADAIGSMRITPGDVERDLTAAGQRVGFRPNVFAPFLERLPRILDAGERITYEGLLAHGLDPIVSRFVGKDAGQFVVVTYIYPPSGADLAGVSAVVREVDPRMQLTGIPVVNRELADRAMPQFAKGIAIGAAAVTLLVWLTFRSVRDTLLALLPTALGFVWSAGLLGLSGMSLDLFSLFAAVTFIGIAVDYAIYMLWRFREDTNLERVASRTGAAIVVACGCALIGFGTLVVSSYAPLRLFGIVSLVTLSCCLAASVLVLPAILAATGRGDA